MVEMKAVEMAEKKVFLMVELMVAYLVALMVEMRAEYWAYLVYL